MDNCESLGNIIFWDEYDVHVWLTGLGLPQYEEQIREHHIMGDILVQLDVEALKEIGIATVGQRLLVLKAVYQVKVAQGVEIGPGAYIPPSELKSLHVETRGTRLRGDTRSNHHRNCQPSTSLCDSDVGGIFLPKPCTVLASQYVPANTQRNNGLEPQYQHEPQHGSFPGTHVSAFRSDKKGKACADDPVWKVLTVALKKSDITEDWRNYVIFISYEGTELRLSHNDRPRRIFKKLQEENKNPVLVLKHISDLQNGFGDLCYPSSKDSHSGISYAVAIHRYKARKGVLANVFPGDSFIVLSKEEGTWLLQRDHSGTGIIDSTQNHIRVPSGCLLGTDIPIAFASAAAFAARVSLGISSAPSLPASNSPILPRNIISNGYQSAAVMNHRKPDDEGVDVGQGEPIHVFKRYKHMAYVVKDDGDRGWVPTGLVKKHIATREDAMRLGHCQ